jgi:type I restriction enzyme, S subunit
MNSAKNLHEEADANEYIAWTRSRLGDICEIVRGVSYKKDQATDKPARGMVPILRASNIQDSALVLDGDLVYVPSEVVSDEQILRMGDIVVATSSGSKHLVGKTAQVKESWRGSFGAFCAALRPKAEIDHRYLGYFFGSQEYKDYIRKKALGVNINNLRRGDLEEISVPVAPLDQQKQIVAEIEKQFSRLDEAVANLKRVKANLKRYKAAVLKAAVEGRLVETEAELARREARSYETGAQLLQRILETRRSQWKGKGKCKEPAAPNTTDLPELPDGWVWTTYAQIGEVTTGFTPPTADAENFGGDIPFFKPTDLDAGENVVQAREYLSEAGAAKGRLLPAGSVLVTCIGATIGKTGLARVSCATNQQINAITTDSGLVNSAFVYAWNVSPNGYKQILDNSSATTLPILNKSKFEALGISLPPLVEQHRIVAELDRRLSLISEVGVQVEGNLKRAERLRQAVLQKAFSASNTDKGLGASQ